jgi:hypothetical protein
MLQLMQSNRANPAHHSRTAQSPNNSVLIALRCREDTAAHQTVWQLRPKNSNYLAHNKSWSLLYT